MKKVAKFGGSSLADASKFQKVKDIVLKDRDIHYVVVSALGKRDKKDNKITDLLYLVYQHAKYHVNFFFSLGRDREEISFGCFCIESCYRSETGV